MRWVMRVFGTLNIVACLLSLYYFAAMIQMHSGRWPGNPTPRDWIVFYAIGSMSTLMVVCGAYLGVRLIRGNPHAIWQTGLLFLIEIVWEWMDVYATWLNVPVSKSTIAVAFWGIADSATEAQVLSGYAILGLVAALVLFMIQWHRHPARA
jgi:hypothetical protein